MTRAWLAEIGMWTILTIIAAAAILVMWAVTAP